MKNKSLIRRKKISRLQMLLFILVFGLIGIIIWKSLAAPNPNLPGDLNNDNAVNGLDLSLLLSAWGTNNVSDDINSDGTVNGLDLSILLSHWGQTYSGGSVLFDGRATKMTTLDVHEVCVTCGYTTGPITWTQSPYGTHYFYVAQSPANTWDCLCFIKNDLALASDSTFGKVYNASVSTGDTNEWQGSEIIDGAGQVSKQRPSNGIGTTEWFGFAVKVPSWSGATSDVRFLDLMSLGYQTSSNDQIALGMRNNGSGQFGYYEAINGGQTGQNGHGTVQGNAPGTSNYVEDLPLNVTFGRWEEFVYGVKWSTNTQTGFLQIYHRTPGGTWSKIYDRENIDTYLWGVITNSNGTLYNNFAPDGSNWSVIDKIGLYFGTHDNAQVTENVQESGLTRSTDLGTAESTLP